MSHVRHSHPYAELLVDLKLDTLETLIKRWVPEQTLKKAREIKAKRNDKVDSD